MTKSKLQQQTRRHFFQDCGIGLGKIALASLMTSSVSQSEAVGFPARLDSTESASGTDSPYAPKAPHFPAKAKRVIYLFMAGAPSQLDLFDYKPKLKELEGKPIPPSVVKGQRYAFIQPDAAVLGPRFPFKQYGQSGQQLSDRLPHLSKVVDDLCFIKSVHTDHFNHSPAQLYLNTGNGVPGRPSLGAWLSYGIGSEADDLPSFVVLKSGGSLSGGAAMWGSGMLSSVHQGVPFRGQGDPILHVSNPQGIDAKAQRSTIDLINQLNRGRFQSVGDPEIQTRINAFETAYKMQSSAPELMDFSTESEATLKRYGADLKQPSKAFANNALLARRLVEKGVRFVQVYHSGWDHHSNVEGGLKGQCAATDQACAALISDLKERGMLEDTLVIWGGEFGRTPMVEASAALGRTLGRDHHPQAFTMWMAGGGIKPGMTLGATDELGFHPIENPVHVQDLQATILHCLGLDHERLSVNQNGLNIRLTGVEKRRVVKQILA